MTLQSWRAYAVCEAVLAWAQTVPTLQVTCSLLSVHTQPAGEGRARGDARDFALGASVHRHAVQRGLRWLFRIDTSDAARIPETALSVTWLRNQSHQFTSSKHHAEPPPSTHTHTPCSYSRGT